MTISNYLGDRRFWRTTMRLCIPIAIQNVLTSSFQLIDTLMVSRLGDVTLSATGMASQWGWLLGLVLFGLCSGMCVFTAQYWGVRDTAGMHRVLGITLCASLCAALLFFLPACLCPRRVLLIFNKDPNVVAIGARYLTIVCFSYPAVALNNVLSFFLRACDRVKLPMYVSGITTVLNILLNTVLIFGYLGFPALGVTGAALATCLSAWAGPLFLYLFSAREKNLLIAPLSSLFSFTRKNLGEFFRRAFPVIGNETLWGLGTVVTSAMFSNLGYEYYAAVTIFRTFSDLAFAFFVGFGNACVIMVGSSIGTGRIQQGIRDSVRFTILVPAIGCLMGGLILLFRPQLIAIFNTSGTISPLTMASAMAILLIYALEVPIRNVPYVQIVGVFRSGGDTFRGMLYDLICLWGLAIPAMYLAAYVWKLPFPAVFAVLYLAEDLPKTILCLRYFRSKKWLRPVTPEGRAGLKAYLAQQKAFR